VAEAHARAQATHGEEERMGEPLLGGTSAVGEASLGGDAPAGEVPMSWRASAPLFRRSTLLPPRSGFVVPGGRFREMYYWDSLWVVLGLMAVGMRQTAEGMCGLLLDQVSTGGAGEVTPSPMVGCWAGVTSSTGRVATTSTPPSVSLPPSLPSPHAGGAVRLRPKRRAQLLPESVAAAALDADGGQPARPGQCTEGGGGGGRWDGV
jgi:hypothetical protein